MRDLNYHPPKSIHNMNNNKKQQPPKQTEPRNNISMFLRPTVINKREKLNALSVVVFVTTLNRIIWFLKLYIWINQ